MIDSEVTIVYEDDDYKVIEYFCHESAPTLVAFNGAGARPFVNGNMGCFGDQAAISLGYNFIGVLKNNNNWYQSDSIITALSCINKLNRKSITTYGASMGGYAAINFASALGAEFFIAICPQYTTNRVRSCILCLLK